MAKKQNPILVILIIIGVIFLFGKFGKQAQFSSQVQYYNEPIVVSFSSDLTDAEIDSYFNDVLRNDSLTHVGSNYTMTAELSSAGMYKVVMTTASDTITYLTEVKQPYVKTTNDIPTTVDENQKRTFTVKTYTPQGDELVADSVSVEITNPDLQTTTLDLVNTSNVWKGDYTYKDAGQYNIKIYPKLAGYTTEETTVISQVVKTEGIHPVVYVWGVAFIIFAILFIVARIRHKKVKFK